MKSDLLKGIVVLICILSVAVAILVSVNLMTGPIIKKNNDDKTKATLKELFPLADHFEMKTRVIDGNLLEYHEAYQDDVILGYAVESGAVGYQSTIRLLIGLDMEKKVSSVIVLDQAETPGLGSRVIEEPFLSQFDGKVLSQIKLKKDGGEIDAVSGATVSSRAFTKAVEDALGRIG